eukprot:6214226-Pleurochrysis_carterae.AAC.1
MHIAAAQIIENLKNISHMPKNNDHVSGCSRGASRPRRQGCNLPCMRWAPIRELEEDMPAGCCSLQRKSCRIGSYSIGTCISSQTSPISPSYDGTC